MLTEQDNMYRSDKLRHGILGANFLRLERRLQRPALQEATADKQAKYIYKYEEGLAVKV